MQPFTTLKVLSQNQPVFKRSIPSTRNLNEVYGDNADAEDDPKACDFRRDSVILHSCSAHIFID
jgi:hypothetical protein